MLHEVASYGYLTGIDDVSGLVWVAMECGEIFGLIKAGSSEEGRRRICFDTSASGSGPACFGEKRRRRIHLIEANATGGAVEPCTGFAGHQD